MNAWKLASWILLAAVCHCPAQEVWFTGPAPVGFLPSDGSSAPTDIVGIWPGTYLEFSFSRWHMRLSNNPPPMVPVHGYEIHAHDRLARPAFRQSVEILPGMTIPVGIVTLMDTVTGCDHFEDVVFAFPTNPNTLVSLEDRLHTFAQYQFRLNDPATWPP